MAELRYPRFNTIYNSREEAINKLDNLSRSYGEPVAIRYYSSDKKEVYVILAMYKSDVKGDYVINFDKSSSSQSIGDLGLGDSLIAETDESGKPILEVNIDDSSLVKGNDGSISVGTVYGGTF